MALFYQIGGAVLVGLVRLGGLLRAFFFSVLCLCLAAPPEKYNVLLKSHPIVKKWMTY